MSFSWPILSTVTFLPLLGALLIAALRGGDEAADRNARFIALWTTLVTFALSLVLWRDFDPTTAQFQFVEQRAWLGVIKFHMAVRRPRPQPSRPLPPSPTPGSPAGRRGWRSKRCDAPGSTGRGQPAVPCACASPAKKRKEPMPASIQGVRSGS